MKFPYKAVALDFADVQAKRKGEPYHVLSHGPDYHVLPATQVSVLKTPMIHHKVNLPPALQALKDAVKKNTAKKKAAAVIKAAPELVKHNGMLYQLLDEKLKAKDYNLEKQQWHVVVEMTESDSMPMKGSYIVFTDVFGTIVDISPHPKPDQWLIIVEPHDTGSPKTKPKLGGNWLDEINFMANPEIDFPMPQAIHDQLAATPMGKPFEIKFAPSGPVNLNKGDPFFHKGQLCEVMEVYKSGTALNVLMPPVLGAPAKIDSPLVYHLTLKPFAPSKYMGKADGPAALHFPPAQQDNIELWGVKAWLPIWADDGFYWKVKTKWGQQVSIHKTKGSLHENKGQIGFLVPLKLAKDAAYI